jgi:peroxiredoxin (alkyl hydroperoxide reductase subunit C)
MLTVGDSFPEFSLDACVSIKDGEEFKKISSATVSDGWKVVFFWPLDFTFVCPTEISAFGERNTDFASRKCQVLGCSTDSKFTHLAWRRDHPALKNLPFPMLADLKRELSSALGILHKQDGVCLRATFIVDPSNTIRWSEVNDLNVGRNVDEVLRVLDALQTEKLTPCGWHPGEKTLN